MLHNEISLAVSARRRGRPVACRLSIGECFSTPCAIEQTMRAWVTAAAAAAATVSASKTPYTGSQCRVQAACKVTCYEWLFLRRVYIIPALSSNMVRCSNRTEILHSACSILLLPDAPSHITWWRSTFLRQFFTVETPQNLYSCKRRLISSYSGYTDLKGCILKCCW